MSTLGYAIMGLLAKRPRTGYEISRAMHRPLGYFWSARHSQIYPELAALESSGFVRSRIIPGPGPRDTRRYTLTRSGKTVLINWLDGPIEEEPVKSELMLRVWSLWLLSPEQARRLIGHVRDEALERLELSDLEEQGFPRGPATADDPSDPDFGSYATLQWGIARRRAFVEWCDWLLQRLPVDADDAADQV